MHGVCVGRAASPALKLRRRGQKFTIENDQKLLFSSLSLLFFRAHVVDGASEEKTRKQAHDLLLPSQNTTFLQGNSTHYRG